jgi:hypothetical protein
VVVITDFIMESFSGQEKFMPVFLLLLAVAAFVGTWIGLSRWHHARFYPIAWTATVLLLTAWWGSALANALIVGKGTPGSGWDAFGAAVIFFFSLPALVLDIVFLLRWPRKRPTGQR